MDVDVLHNDSEPGLEVNGKGDEGKQTYKSFKKKYRKMRFKFEEVMSESNDLCMKEQNAAETAKRLAQENELAYLSNYLWSSTNLCAAVNCSRRSLK